MGFRIPPTVIAIFLAAVIAFASARSAGDGQALLIGVGGFVMLASTLAVAAGATATRAGAAVNARVLAAIFFVLSLVLQLAFAWVGGPTLAYLVAAGLCFGLFALLTTSVVSSRQ